MSEKLLNDDPHIHIGLTIRVHDRANSQKIQNTQHQSEQSHSPFKRVGVNFRPCQIGRLESTFQVSKIIILFFFPNLSIDIINCDL